MKRLALAAMLLALAACSSAPVETAPTTVRELRDAEACAQVGPCLPIRADNQLYNDATIYINGTRVGQLSGNSNKTFWIRSSTLVEGNCVYAVAVFRTAGFTLSESRQCGDSFRLSIGAEGKLWVIAREASKS
jgi:hypothetical protein